MAASNSFINQLLDAAFRGQTYTGGTIKIGLFRSGLPSTGGVEVSGGGYTRQILTFAPATNRKISTATSATFVDVPTSQTVVAYGVYDGTTLIDERMLDQAFTADITNNELKVNYSFELGS